jgi:DNA polymerase III subunit gamma/tau
VLDFAKQFCFVATQSETADAWNFGLCATPPREPRQARKGATVPGSRRVPRSTRSSSHRFYFQALAKFMADSKPDTKSGANSDKTTSYQVIARKWRPQTFADVVGQSHVMTTLENAIRTNRIAHAYIFSGARGVGKTTTARILAKALNCVKGPTPTPCNECDSCREITAGNSMDVIEIDAASNRGIDQIRELRDMVRYAATGGHHKVIILDEAHMLTDEASNALLKTLEEPPDRVIFVMATTEPDKLADTIRSRSQHFHFRALSFAEINGALAEIAKKEGLKADPEALGVMARAAEGSLRDALSLLEQARSYSGTEITDASVRELLGVVPEEALGELVTAIEQHSADKVLELVHRFQKEGRNLQHFCRETIRHFRNLLVAKVCGADSELIAATPEQRPELARAAALFSEEDLTRYFQILLDTDDDLRRKPDPRIHLEMGLLRMVNASRLAPLEKVLAELNGEGAPRATATHSATPVPSRSAGSSASSAAGISSANVPKPAPAPSTQAVASPFASGASSWTPAQQVRGTTSDPTILVAQAAAAAGEIVDSTVVEKEAPFVHAAAASSSPTSEAPIPRVEPGVIATSINRSAAAAETIIRAAVQASGIDPTMVDAIKLAIQQKQRFLAELVDHAHKWELEGSELRLYFSSASKTLAQMLEAREPLEKLRAIVSDVTRSALRVCVRMDSTAETSTVRAANATLVSREQIENDPIVRGMLERFGGQITEVKRRGEG